MPRPSRDWYWLTYFIFLAVTMLVGVVMLREWRWMEFVDLSIFAVAMTGLFGYAWCIDMLHKTFWKIFFFVQLGWNIAYGFVEPPASVGGEGIPETPLMYFVGAVIIFGPMVYALYKYAFSK